MKFFNFEKLLKLGERRVKSKILKMRNLLKISKPDESLYRDNTFFKQNFGPLPSIHKNFSENLLKDNNKKFAFHISELLANLMLLSLFSENKLSDILKM